jgi:hypothetical protein
MGDDETGTTNEPASAHSVPDQAAGLHHEGPSIHATFVNASGHPGTFHIWDASLTLQPSPTQLLFNGPVGDGDTIGPFGFFPESDGASTGAAGVRLVSADGWAEAGDKVSLPVSDGQVQYLVFGR